MAPQLISSADRMALERQLLDRLLGLYAEQKELYGEVLDISRNQRELVQWSD